MSAQTDSPTNPNYDLMIKQAMKSKSKKQFRVVGVMVIADREAFNSANSDGEETDKQVVFSQAIASLSSKTIQDTITFMNSNTTTWWGYRTTEMMVYDVVNQEVVMVGVDARTL
jgi:hypothetical protein